MGADLIATLVVTASMGAELSVVEGVMGFFDGAAARGQSGSGTTADLASLLGWPVLLSSMLPLSRSDAPHIGMTSISPA